MAELNNVRPKQPFFFLKPPSSLVLPGAGPCVRPRGVDLHYEIELALIIGKPVRDLKPDDEHGALDAIDSEAPRRRACPFAAAMCVANVRQVMRWPST